MGRAIMKQRAFDKGIWYHAPEYYLCLLLGYKVVVLHLGAHFCHGGESKLKALVLLQCELPNALCTLELPLSCLLLFIQVSLQQSSLSNQHSAHLLDCASMHNKGLVESGQQPAKASTMPVTVQHTNDCHILIIG